MKTQKRFVEGIGKVTLDATAERVGVELSGAPFGIADNLVEATLLFEDGIAKGDGVVMTYPKLAKLTDSQIQELSAMGWDIDPITPFLAAVKFGKIVEANGKRVEWVGW